ncbi:TonB-dependent receptor [Chitinophaga horti]|uniref:TonB-dependent receptor n=1 Tax=Chitinophaga horti TaxID=2920382 RepID=A0ABY6J641_9BACT|nr:TonB-dependent receptor [Chitinophaga horti]UYQ94057.1 TonB-dependent receptor [Chitinophaga horti]
MRRFITLLVLLFPTTLLVAQTGQFTVTGSTKDNAGAAVPFSTAVLFRSKDSSQVTGAVADEKGVFRIKAAAGKYFLKISLLSYKDHYVNNINLNKDVNVGTITLKVGSKTLSQVEIVGEKKLMELELDKRVYNVSQDVANIGANASEVLANVPSVTVDVDGNVALRGSQGVRILIDGKPSALTGIKSTDALRNLQGAMIDRIEVVTNPSSRFDAAGETGVINIILKKNKTRGFNGNFTGTLGYPQQLGAAYSINYRNEKVNLFSSFGINNRKGPGSGNSSNRFSSKDTAYYYTQRSTRDREDLGANIMAGLDYYLNDYTTLTGSVLYSGGKEKNVNRLRYDDFFVDDMQIKNSSLRVNDEDAREENTEASLSFRKKYANNDKREWTADAKWTSSGDIEKSMYRTSPVLNGAALELQRSDNPTWEKTLLLQTDYIHPFGKDAKLEAGFKGTLRTVTNDFLVEEFDNTAWTPLGDFDNNMEYKERIYAAYAMFGSKVGKFSYQLGLRGELSDISTGLLKTNEINDRNYFNVFPSTSLSYQLDKANTLQLSYSYRINRPNYRDLTPFSDFSDPRVYFVGNPNLDPEYAHSIDAGHLLEWDKGSILSSVYYRHKTGVVYRYNDLDSTTGITNIRPINLSTRDDIGIEFNLSLTLADWWKFNTSANVYHAISNGSYLGRNLDATTTTMTNRTTSRMTFFKSLDFQASLNYQAPRITPQGKDLAQYSIDLGLAQDILKDKGTLTFNVRDLLNTRRRRAITDIMTDSETYYSRSDFQWRARQLTLTLNYRLNQQKIDTKEKEEGFGEN